MEKLFKKFSSAGYDVEKVTFSFGRYYDGTEKGFECNGLMLTLWADKREFNDASIIRAAVKRRKNLKIYKDYFNGSYHRFDIIAADDCDPAAAAERECDVFQNVFWQAIHEQKDADTAMQCARSAVLCC